MNVINVDGKKYKVNKTNNLLQACLSLGLDIPYFCWHPALGSVGACRQCAVKQYQDTQDTRGRLVMSCMTPVSNNMYVSIEDQEAQQFRKNIVEWLMINHPHDCPVCEEGGNCHLQDMTVMTGHNFRRYRFLKRTHFNQNLGPFISHEMNRCIACYRCVRYYRDYADGSDFNVYGIRDNIYFGRLEDGMLENEFSGNLVEICPTGVFVDKTYSKHYSRKWDMQYAPSICQQCSLGCNIILAERYGKLRRIENRYNSSINQYFLCDRGRFGYGYINLENRPRQPTQHFKNQPNNLNVEQTIHNAAKILRQLKKIIGIGSPRASIENNFALRELVGTENFCTGMTTQEQQCLQLVLGILRNSGIYIPTLREVESYDAIVILGEDLTQTGARAALAVRQAVKGKSREMASMYQIPHWHTAAVMNITQHTKHPLFITSIDTTRLDDIAEWTYYAPVEDQARLGFAIAHILDKTAVPVKGLSNELKDRAKKIASTLSNAKKPLIISGTHAGSIEIIQAAANIAKALKERNIAVGIMMIANEVNSIGVSMVDGIPLEVAFSKLNQGSNNGIIVMENDLYRHFPADYLNDILSKISLIMVIDHQHTMLTKKAHFVLSAASFAESDGTVINNEGRAQRFFRVYDPSYYNNNIIMLESWRWLHLLHTSMYDNKVEWTQLDHVINAIKERIPQLAGIQNAAPNAKFRIHGQKVARSPYCYSGRTAMNANVSIHEPRQPLDENTMFAFSMEGNSQSLFAKHSQIPFVWAPGWNSPQAWNKFQSEIGNSLRYGDPGIRLITLSKESINYFTTVPPHFEPMEGSLRVVLYYHLFGSDELSQRSPVFQENIPPLNIKLSLNDANKLGIKSGTILSLKFDNQIVKLPLIISEKLSVGQIGLPMGMIGVVSTMSGVYIDNSQISL